MQKKIGILVIFILNIGVFIIPCLSQGQELKAVSTVRISVEGKVLEKGTKKPLVGFNVFV